MEQAVDGGPATDAVEYTSFPVDLMAVHKRDIQRLVIVAATSGATITVTLPDQTADRVLNVAQGDSLPIRARSIVSVTNITRVRAYWGAF